MVNSGFRAEQVARIVRQINPVKQEGLTILHNAYQEQQSEFVRSTDPLFRPVDMTTAPDGTMYITDMYHGIIQEGQWVGEGSYLRIKVQQYQLDKVVSLGRIWRLKHKDYDRDETQPRMYEQSSEELLAHLSHPNGWWRDMAQQVLVQRRDQSVAPQLAEMVRSHHNLLARFHALWVLEGIGSLESALIIDMMQDPNPRMRKQAMWAGESLYKAGDLSLISHYQELMKDGDREVRMRALMTGRLLKIPGTEQAARRERTASDHAGIQLVAQQVIDPPQITSYFGRMNPNFNEAEQALVNAGADIYQSLCATCHGTLGGGTPTEPGELMAPSLIGNTRIQSHPEYIVKTLLHGMNGDIDGQSYTGIMMAPMGNNTDEWVASISSFVRANFENESSIILPEEVSRIRRQTADRKKAYTYEELRTSIPYQLIPNDNWKLTASHTGSVRKGSRSSPLGAMDFEGWTTGVTQDSGMWFQIELPELTQLTELTFVSPAISRGWRKGSPPPIGTYPRQYNVEISKDGKTWTRLLSNCKGVDSPVRIIFEPTEGKFLRITLTKSEEIVHGERFGQPFDYEVVWKMQELKVYSVR